MALCICVAAFAADDLIFLAVLLLLDLLLGALGHVFRKAVSLAVGLGKICLFLFVLLLLFVREGTILFLFITDTGVYVAARLVLRLLSACIPLALMLAVTQMNDLANALVKVLRLPYKYAFTLTTAIRFIPLFIAEMSGITEAQTARGVEFDSVGFLRKMKLILPLCVPLLIISVRKIDGTAVSAEVRGFHLRTYRSGYKSYGSQAADISAVIFCGSAYRRRDHTLRGRGVYVHENDRGTISYHIKEQLKDLTSKACFSQKKLEGVAIRSIRRRRTLRRFRSPGKAIYARHILWVCRRWGRRENCPHHFFFRYDRNAGHYSLHGQGCGRLGHHVQSLLRMAGITKLDRVHITPGYGLWTAGIGFPARRGAPRRHGQPMGPGNTAKQLRMMIDLKSTVLCATLILRAAPRGGVC